MRSKKISRLLACFLMIVMVLTGCGGETEAPAGTTAKPTAGSADETKEDEVAAVAYPLTIRAGISTGIGDPRGAALEQMKEEIEKGTQGQIILEIHPDGELGSDGDLIAGLISKDVDMTVSSAGNYALYATRLGVSALPFLFDDFESAWKFIDSDTIQAINEDLEKFNMHVLAYFDNGFRCVTTGESTGMVKNVSDMKGLNIRTPDNQIVMETMSELGANPRSYPFAELKAALKDGTFDAQENPIPVIYNSKLFEEQSYLSITNHSYDAMPLTIRSDLWRGIDRGYKNIILEAAEHAQVFNRSLVKKQTEEYVEKLEKEGMEVEYPDLTPFREATKGVSTVFENVFGRKLLEFVEDFR